MKSNRNKYYLTNEQRQFYDDYGYVVIKGLIENDTLSIIRQRFLDVCNNAVPKGAITVIRDLELLKVKQNPEDYINKINFLGLDPVFARHTEHPRLLHVLSQLIGNRIAIYNSMMINKPPGTTWHPPHQDMFHLPLRPFNKVVTTWTAVDPVTPDNGCLFVIPGSHKANTLYPQVTVPDIVNRYYFTIPNVDEVAPEKKRVSLAPMQPGDTIFINSLLVHGSWPNRSNNYRKAITNIYASSDCEYVDVKGTVQEAFEREVNKGIKEVHGNEADDITLQDFWSVKRKEVNNLRSNL